MDSAVKSRATKAPPAKVAPAKKPASDGDHGRLYRDIVHMTPAQRQVMLLQRDAGNLPVSRLVGRRRLPTVHGAGPRLSGSISAPGARVGIGGQIGQAAQPIEAGSPKPADTGVATTTATATAGTGPVVPGTASVTSPNGPPPNGATSPNGTGAPPKPAPPNGASGPYPVGAAQEIGVGAAAGMAVTGAAGAEPTASGVGKAAGEAAAGEATPGTAGVGEAAGEAAAAQGGGVGQAGGEAAEGAGEGAGKAAAGPGKAAAGAAKGAGKRPAKAGRGAAAAGAAGGVGAAAGQAAAGAGTAGGPTKPGYHAVIAKIGKAKAKLSKHGAPAAKVGQAHGAAKPPSNDVGSRAAAAQVGVMGAQQPKPFDRAGFIAAVEQAISKATPSDGDEAEDFKSTGKAEQAKKDVSGLVKQNKDASAGPIESATEAPPPTAGIQPKPVAEMPEEKPGAPPKPINAAAAMPDPRPKSETDLSAGPKQVKGEMEEAEVTDEQLRKSNEPAFVGAADAKKEAEDNSKAAPKEFRAQEKGVLTDAKATVNQESQGALGAMTATRRGATGKVGKEKDQLKARDEAAHAEISAKIDSIYATTKQEVTGILDALDGKVESEFGSGEATARSAFETYVKQKFDAYEEDRYSGLGGSLRRASDWAFGMPDEVNRFYVEGHSVYIEKMKGVIGRVADVVEAELNRAKARIAQGRDEVKTYVDKLPKNQRDFGKQAMDKVTAQFDSLDEEVNSKGDDLVQTVAQKYKEADAAVNARIDEMKAENSGFVNKAINAVKGVIKTIMQLKDMLMGVLARAVSAVKMIIKDPIGFLGNLVNAVQAGLKGFMSRIGTHLKNALMDWLLGPIGEMGITMPKELDFKGILSLVLQLLGLTWANIRAQLVKALGERVVSAMESAVDIVKTLVTEGVGGLWKFLQDKVGDIKEQVLGQIKSFVIQKVVVGGITWLLSLLNPASAFVKACKAIYDIVMFIVERGSQIKEFVDSILDSIVAIAKGGTGAVASLVENSLAKVLPLAINFLASLLGLGGIGDKVKKIIETVRKPVNMAVQWLIKKVKTLGKRMFGGVMGKAKAKFEAGKAFVKGKIEVGKKWAKGKIEAGKAYVKGKVAGVKQSVKDKLKRAENPDATGSVVVPFKMGGKSHRLIADPKSGGLVMASAAGIMTSKIRQAVEQAKAQREAIDAARAEIEFLESSGKLSPTRQQLLKELKAFVGRAESVVAVRKSFASQETELHSIEAAAQQVEAILKQRQPPPGRRQVEGRVKTLADKLEGYASRYDLSDLGPLAPKQPKTTGAVDSYQDLKSGRDKQFGTLEAEHIVPGSIISMLVRSVSGRKIYMKNEDDPAKSQYHQDTTLLLIKFIADVKTDEGSGGLLSDQDRIREIKEMVARVSKAVAAGEDVDPNDVVQLNKVVDERRRLTKKARDLVIARLQSRQLPVPPNATVSRRELIDDIRSSVSDARIDETVLRQLSGVWDLAKAAQARSRAKPQTKKERREYLKEIDAAFKKWKGFG